DDLRSWVSPRDSLDAITRAIPHLARKQRRWHPSRMRTTVLCFCALLLFAAGPAHATEQLKDEIKLDGGTHHLLNFPLGYPEDWSNPVEANLRGVCSGAWRRYKAFWEVRDEQLWL